MKDKMTKLAFLTIALGFWQMATPLTFFHLFCSECGFFVTSDFLSGCVLVLLGIFLVRSFHPVCSGWLVGVVGVWLQFSPLILWAHSSLAYINDTMVGAIAIVFAFQFAKSDNVKALSYDCPKGWSYNPSAWKHRIPTIGLAMLCWFFARYMASYQLGYISEILDPFFADGTLRVVTSNVSRAFPISDAGLGALFYSLEALLGWQGDERRWQTMPWVVFAYAFLVVPGGIISIIMIILQPVVAGAWCTWYLATALCMLLMIVLTAGELVASWQFVKESCQRGVSFSHVFWKGGNEVSDGRGRQPVKKRDAWGISIPWNLAVSAFAGLLLMILPSLLKLYDRLAVCDYVEGPIVLAIAVLSMAEVFRALRFCLAPLGAWLIIAPFVLTSPGPLTVLCHIIIGLFLVAQIWVKTVVKERYGACDSLIF